jgi:hypothetical protein
LNELNRALVLLDKSFANVETKCHGAGFRTLLVEKLVHQMRVVCIDTEGFDFNAESALSFVEGGLYFDFAKDQSAQCDANQCQQDLLEVIFVTEKLRKLKPGAYTCHQLGVLWLRSYLV